jgi:hypothetical protein
LRAVVSGSQTSRAARLDQRGSLVPRHTPRKFGSDTLLSDAADRTAPSVRFGSGALPCLVTFCEP